MQAKCKECKVILWLPVLVDVDELPFVGVVDEELVVDVGASVVVEVVVVEDVVVDDGSLVVEDESLLVEVELELAAVLDAADAEKIMQVFNVSLKLIHCVKSRIISMNLFTAATRSGAASVCRCGGRRARC